MSIPTIPTTSRSGTSSTLTIPIPPGVALISGPENFDRGLNCTTSITRCLSGSVNQPYYTKEAVSTFQEYMLVKYPLLQNVSGNGDCMFFAIIHQMRGLTHGLIDERHLRRTACTFILTHIDQFEPFWQNEAVEKFTSLTDRENRLMDSLLYCGSLELHALAIILGHPIAVWEKNEIGDLRMKPELILPQPHRMRAVVLHIFHSGEHYQSVCFRDGRYGPNTPAHVTFGSIVEFLIEPSEHEALPTGRAGSPINSLDCAADVRSVVEIDCGIGVGLSSPGDDDITYVGIKFALACSTIDLTRCSGPQELEQLDVLKDRKIPLLTWELAKGSLAKAGGGSGQDVSSCLFKTYLAEQELRSRPDEIIFEHYDIPMTRRKFSCLRPRKWLNDEVC
jgi:OTU-like cysteine protease